MAESTVSQQRVRSITTLESSVDTLSDQCDVAMRESLLALVQETKDRQADIERTIGDARNALDDMRLATASLSFSENANLNDAQKAVRMIEDLEFKLDGR